MRRTFAGQRKGDSTIYVQSISFKLLHNFGHLQLEEVEQQQLPEPRCIYSHEVNANEKKAVYMHSQVKESVDVVDLDGIKDWG